MKKLFLILFFIILMGVPVLAAPGSTPPILGQQPRTLFPVSDPRMVVTGSNGTTRTFSITWQRPGLGNEYNSGLTPAELDAEMWTWYPTAYNIQFRNATLNEPWNASITPFRFDTGLSQAPIPQSLQTPITRNMSSNSLYQIQVLPYNRIPRVVVLPPIIPGGPPIRSVEWIDAPIDRSPSAIPIQRDIIYLTDVNLDMTKTFGHGNSITLEWFNPTFNGLNVFDEWIVGFLQHDRTNPNRSVITNGFTKTVPISEIDILPGGRLRYTISHVDIVPMMMYNVAVEPRRSGRRIRPIENDPLESNPRGPFMMPDGLQYNFAFSPLSAMEFRSTNPILMAPELHLEILGADLIRLLWSRFDGMAMDIERIEVEEWLPGIYGRENPFEDISERTQIIEVIEGPENISRINTAMLGPNHPRDVRCYTIAVYIRGANDPAVRTNPVLYDPTYVEFAPYRPEIINLGAQILSENMGVLTPLQFQAFARAPYVQEEMPLVDQEPHSSYNPPGTQTPRIIDLGLYYEIYVADSWETLEYLYEPLIVVDPAQLLLVPYQSHENVNPPVFDPSWQLPSPITEFYIRTNDGIEKRTIEGNRIYYVKIRAIRDAPGRQTSLWAYGTVFMPPFGGIPSIPEMISAPPVEIVREAPLELDIRWPLRYLEIQHEKATDERDMWHAMVGVAPDGNLIFGRSATQIENATAYNMFNFDGTPRYAILNNLLIARDRNSLLGEGMTPLDISNPMHVGAFLSGPARDAVDGFLNGLGALYPNGTPPALRIQDMVGKQYEIHVVEYDHMMRIGTQESYYDDDNPFEIYRAILMRGQQGPSMWERINPTLDAGEGMFTVSSMHAPTRGALSPNKAYVIFIRTYEVTSAGILVSYYPTFVLGNTVSDIDRPIHDPTTPVLYPVPEFITDYSIGVRWRVQDDTGYELFISERMADHPSGGTLIPPPLRTQAEIDAALEDPEIPFEIRELNGVPYYFLRIKGLFPDTQYYVWAIAYGLDEDGEVATNPSQPSNPVDMKTKDIDPPRPPAIAPAPQTLLDVYNKMNDTDLNPREPDALNILLNRIFADYDNDPTRADSGTAENGSVIPINLPADLYGRLHIIRFQELIANKTYFVRARTILTVERAGGLGAPVTRTFSYEIQLADNDEFLDPVIFTIPALPSVNLGSNNVRRAISEWVYIEIDTGRSGDEYDGVHRPEQYPLPDRDWEMTYDPETQTLKWRFRTNQIGADNRPDQNVDQRFISRLISERTFIYTIDMSEYRNYPITNRTVEIPESIIRAFNTHKIIFEIDTGSIKYSVTPGAFDTAEVRALQNNPRSFFSINMNGNPNNMPELVPNTSFATIPQRLIITAHTNDANDRQIALNTFAQPIGVVLSLNGYVTPVGPNTGLFNSGRDIQGWQDMNGRFNNAAGTVTAEIRRPGTFAGITRNSPVSEEPSNTDVPMQRVTSRINITDLVSYNPNREVTANEMNNIIIAIIGNRTSVTMGANIPAASIQSLTRSKMLVPQDFDRETAIDIMVRVYENRTKQNLRPRTPINSIPGAQNVTPAFQNNIRKAADIGFITGPLEPNGKLTMGELMNMVDIIIEDSGI